MQPLFYPFNLSSAEGSCCLWIYEYPVVKYWNQPLNTLRLGGDCSRYGLDRLWGFTATVFAWAFAPVHWKIMQQASRPLPSRKRPDSRFVRVPSCSPLAAWQRTGKSFCPIHCDRKILCAQRLISKVHNLHGAPVRKAATFCVALRPRSFCRP